MSKDGLPRAASSPRFISVFSNVHSPAQTHRGSPPFAFKQLSGCQGRHSIYIHEASLRHLAIRGHRRRYLLLPSSFAPSYLLFLSSAHQHQMSVATSSTSFLFSKSCTLICRAHLISRIEILLGQVRARQDRDIGKWAVKTWESCGHN